MIYKTKSTKAKGKIYILDNRVSQILTKYSERARSTSLAIALRNSTRPRNLAGL